MSSDFTGTRNLTVIPLDRPKLASYQRLLVHLALSLSLSGR